MIRKEWTLKHESELRCEVNDTEPLIVNLTRGSAEIFGIEMPLQKEFVFVDENLAIFSWYGCDLETYSTPSSVLYTADSTPMIAYANTHIQLEAMRDTALANDVYGPNVLIVGPNDHGKSTTSRILASYAVRLDRMPVFVDLDVSQGNLTIPGCLTAVVLEKNIVNVEV